MSPIVNENNNSNDTNTTVALKEQEIKETGGSFWEETQALLDQAQEEMATLSEGKDVRLVGEEATDEFLKLSFELDGLKKDSLKISMTQSNFLEIEHVADNKAAQSSVDDGQSLIWAYPIGQGYKNQDITVEFSGQSSLVVKVPKDPDYKPSEESDSVVVSALSLWNPFAAAPEMDAPDEEVEVQTIEPVQAEVTENADGFVIEMNIENFEPEEVNISLGGGHVLKVEGQKKEKEEAEVQNQDDQAEVTDSKIRRKSFGRMFWVPDGCDRDKIEAKAKIIYSYLNLEISVPRSTSVPEKTTGGADSNKTINIPIIVL